MVIGYLLLPKIAVIVVRGMTRLVFRRGDLSAGCRKAYVDDSGVQEGLSF